MKRIILLNLIVFSCLITSCQKEGESSDLPFNFSVDIAETESFKFAQSRTFSIEGVNVEKVVALAPKGWLVNIGKDAIEVISPAWKSAEAEYSGEIELKAISTQHNQKDIVIASDVQVSYTSHTITFEGIDPNYLAGPTAYGENLYTGSSGYVGYLDQTSKLFFHTTTTGYGFASGGIAISQWNDKSTAGYLNQCSVFYGDDGQKNGGNNDSSTFAVSFTSVHDNSGAYMFFEDGEEHFIDHAYFTNNTYAALSMMYGDQFARVHTYDERDWFKLIIVGIDKNGAETGQAECYLSDFRRSTSAGILKEWIKTDLSPLGKVNKVQFRMDGTDGGQYGLNTPAYFCMDDITVILESV